MNYDGIMMILAERVEELKYELEQLRQYGTYEYRANPRLLEDKIQITEETLNLNKNLMLEHCRKITH